mgnify:CR=1 FL=1
MPFNGRSRSVENPVRVTRNVKRVTSETDAFRYALRVTRYAKQSLFRAHRSLENVKRLASFAGLVGCVAGFTTVWLAPPPASLAGRQFLILLMTAESAYTLPGQFISWGPDGLAGTADDIYP